ncbi:hypothetical protein [Devosia nitrariae]|uniref:Uncharacterized protein n=1 Tax=Devosia nitrariae TaxID=2071872 RepID=A0ABQ5W1A9_9HYPH|nr:hypothetical protein [Devosia nitrariae]GLQ53628.1 hypothetical protein GCM10010862_08870 [Devosia nitrariae]
MPRIAPPDLAASDLDYQLRCEFEMEVAFIEVAEAAESAGWDPTIIARAMKSLAKNYMLSREANAETDRQIELALTERR